MALGKSYWTLIDVVAFKLLNEEGRTLRLDDEAESKLLPVAEQPLKDIIVLMRDTGMRNAREFYRFTARFTAQCRNHQLGKLLI